ncbi:hypothetical protein [Streptomyces antimicrobicus]|uniref:Uncharacterized protein n=1 Tax=Streptomyces antimicrobicus TaxID=2883108 RepID=A0ABS8B4N0_9ACTN|nr:hypothetical protein [Streptomyces antimicrobicus]MCB5179544.1 hypothetical protein [Streptomyces antimicrobicus]
MSYEQIAEMYGVTKGAVYWQLRDSGQTKKRPDHKRYLPWTVKAEHAHARPAMMLRLLSRQESGDTTIPDVKARMLAKWLGEVRKADVVVCYDRSMPPNPASPNTGGFYYSKRRPEDDAKSLIRFNPKESEATQAGGASKALDSPTTGQ